MNRRQMKCDSCGNKFSEEFETVKKKRTYTEKSRTIILAEVLASDIKSVAQRQGVSEQEIETMLRELGEELIPEKPRYLR
jgi:transposase-like protein